MKEIPSLFSLCVKTLTWNIMHGCGQSQDLFELPSAFLDGLLMILPSLALQNIYELLNGSTSKEASIVNNINIRRKRGRYNELNAPWETLYKKRWPENIKKKLQSSCTAADHGMEAHDSTAPVMDWQQLYWEGHLQDCLDAATEQALLPAFGGNITALEIPDGIMNLIGHTVSGACNCSNLSYHCLKFGRYARCLAELVTGDVGTEAGELFSFLVCSRHQTATCFLPAAGLSICLSRCAFGTTSKTSSNSRHCQQQQQTMSHSSRRVLLFVQQEEKTGRTGIIMENFLD